MQIAGALIKQDAPKETAVAVIPMGTANDFATAAGIPDDPWEALQLAVHDTAYPVDVGLVNDEVYNQSEHTSNFNKLAMTTQISASIFPKNGSELSKVDSCNRCLNSAGDFLLCIRSVHQWTKFSVSLPPT